MKVVTQRGGGGGEADLKKVVMLTSIGNKA
jgi:hypothetical protein